jgi:hypothetical protein
MSSPFETVHRMWFEPDEDQNTNLTTDNAILLDLDKRGHYNRLPAAVDDQILTHDDYGRFVQIYSGEWRW